MKTFESIFTATAESLKNGKKPIVLGRNKRAVEAAIDSAKDQKMDSEEALDKVLNVINDGKTIDVNKFLELTAEIESAETTIATLEKFKSEFFAE
jgi:hypothetical protein